MTGKRKAHEEFQALKSAQRYTYAPISVATSLRYALGKDELLLAQADARDEGLAALERLVARHLVVPARSRDQFRCRHRVIADLVFDKLLELHELTEVLIGLAWAHRAAFTPEGKRIFLQRLADVVEEGLRFHPRAENLLHLRNDLKREILLTVVSGASAPPAPLR